MAELDIQTFEDYDAFAREWHADTLADRDVSLEEARERGLINEQETRQLWQLVGLLDEDELFIQLPGWLAEEKVGFTDGAVPTVFIGRIARETEKAILFEDSAAARPLMQLAHRIHSLREGIESTSGDEDRRNWLEDRLRENRQAFNDRDDVTSLRDEWIPKSQLLCAIRRE